MNEAYMSETLMNKYETQATEYDYARLVAAIELLEYQIAVVENRDTPAPSPGLERGIPISKLKEVLVVAGKKQKEIEVI